MYKTSNFSVRYLGLLTYLYIKFNAYRLLKNVTLILEILALQKDIYDMYLDKVVHNFKPPFSEVIVISLYVLQI